MTDTPNDQVANDESEDQNPPLSVPMSLFNNGDYRSARQHLDSATTDESVFLKRALAWDGYLTLSIGVFFLIWLSAVYSTAT